MCVTAIVLSIGTKFVNNEEIVSGTLGEDSVTLRLSSLRVFTGKCIVCFVKVIYCFYLLEKRNQAAWFYKTSFSVAGEYCI